MTPFNFQIKMSKSRVKLYIRITVCSISWKTFAWYTLNLIHWYILKSRKSPLILRSKSERSSVKLDVGIYWQLNILRTLCSTDIKLCTLVHPTEKMVPYNVQVQSQSQGSNWTLEDMLSAQYLENTLFDRHQTWYAGTSYEIDNPFLILM
jgi:hypothetical protein